MVQPTPGGNINPANLNLNGLNALAAVLGTDNLLIAPTAGGPNRRVSVSAINAQGVPDPLLLGDGTIVDPTYSFLSESTTGIFLAAASQMSLIANSIAVADITETGGVPQMIVDPGRISSNALPGLALGDGDTGFKEGLDDQLVAVIGATPRWSWIGNQFSSFQANAGPFFLDVDASATVPNIGAANNDADTGIGTPGSDQLSLIAGALDCINISEVGAARQIGFYVTAPIALQTGVAVTDVAIHAALVALGLITA